MLLFFRNFPSHEPFSSPEVMRENKEYIRQKRPINFTMADLEKDAEECEDKPFESHVQPSISSRSVPKRNCNKKIVNAEIIESED